MNIIEILFSIVGIITIILGDIMGIILFKELLKIWNDE